MFGITREHGAQLFYGFTKICTVVSGIAFLGCVVVGEDSTYPSVVAALSAAAYFSIWLTRNTAETIPLQPGTNSLKQNAVDAVDRVVDVVSEGGKSRLKSGRDAAVTAGVLAVKTGVMTVLPSAVREMATGSVDTTLGWGARSVTYVTDASIDASINISGGIVKKSANRSITTCYQEN